MLEGFKPIHLTSGLPSISITENGLTFSKSAVLKMDKAQYVLLLLDEEGRRIAIQPCAKDEPNATPFFNPGKKVVSVRWNNKDFLNTIKSLTGWTLGEQGYRVNGTFMRDDRALVFPLMEAEVFSTK